MPAIDSAGIFVEYSVLTIPHFLWYNIHVLKGRTQRRSPGTGKAYKWK